MFHSKVLLFLPHSTASEYFCKREFTLWQRQILSPRIHSLFFLLAIELTPFHPSTESSEHTASWLGTDIESGGPWIGTNWWSRRHKAILNDRQTYHLGVRKGIVWSSYSLIATPLLSSKPLRPATLPCFLSPGHQEVSMSGSQHISHLGNEKLNHEWKCCNHWALDIFDQLMKLTGKCTFSYIIWHISGLSIELHGDHP